MVAPAARLWDRTSHPLVWSADLVAELALSCDDNPLAVGAIRSASHWPVGTAATRTGGGPAERQLAGVGGPEIIEDVTAADFALTRDERDPDAPLAFEPVARTFTNVTEAVVWLTIADAGGTIGSVGATAGHPFWVASAGPRPRRWPTSRPARSTAVPTTFAPAMAARAPPGAAGSTPRTSSKATSCAPRTAPPST